MTRHSGLACPPKRWDPESNIRIMLGLSFFSIVSIITLMVVYFFLITEKLNKVIVAVLGATFLIFMQVFRTAEHTSQEGAVQFISHNLDILGFVLGMMVLVGIVKESGFFEMLAIWLVKKVKGRPFLLLLVFSYLSLFMTTFFSNIPTILILTPVLIVLIKQLKLPYLPYFFAMVTMANIGGAMTPISDPTTYYQAKTVGLGFLEVISNSGFMVLLLSPVVVIYTMLVFRKSLRAVKVDTSSVELFEPKSALKNMTVLRFGLPLLFLTVLLMISKELIHAMTGITLDNASITIGASFLAILLFHKDVQEVFKHIIDWEILFFFTGLFVVVGALEFTHVIDLLAEGLIQVTGGNLTALALLTSTGSAVLSTFIDNVPYNITMVGAIQGMAKSGMEVYPLWWALNLGTSIGGAGSPIAAACNVIAFSQAEKEKFHLGFAKYLLVSLPLVVINSLLVFGMIWLKFLS